MFEPRNMFPEGTPTRRVIDYATKEFFTKGVKQVTMDDIAKGLQMSKRTLYQLFADKEQLIIACIELITEHEQKLAHSLFERDYNVLEIILRIIEFRTKGLENVSPQYIIDITRYKSVQEYYKLAQAEAVERAEVIFGIGIKQGFFRDDVNVTLLMKCLFSQMNNAVTQSLIAEYSIQSCFVNIGLFHLRGCCTAKGIELIDRFLEYYRKEQKTINTPTAE